LGGTTKIWGGTALECPPVATGLPWRKCSTQVLCYDEEETRSMVQILRRGSVQKCVSPGFCHRNSMLQNRACECLINQAEMHCRIDPSQKRRGFSRRLTIVIHPPIYKSCTRFLCEAAGVNLMATCTVFILPELNMRLLGFLDVASSKISTAKPDPSQMRLNNSVTEEAPVWGAVRKNIIPDRFSTKTAISAHI